MNKKLNFFIQTNATLSEEQIKMFITLVDANSTKLITMDEKPQYCGSQIVNDQFTIYAELKGMIDVDMELKKLEKEVANITQWKDKLQALMDSENYTRMPEKLR